MKPYTYDAYGNCVTGGIPCATGEPFKYTGQRQDPETGLYYYRARFYSPLIGRFLQTDPIGYSDDLNWYAYVGNDPANSDDPSGEDASDCASQTGCIPTYVVTVDVPPPPPPPSQPTWPDDKPPTVNKPTTPTPQPKPRPDAGGNMCPVPQNKSTAIANGFDSAASFFKNLGFGTAAIGVGATITPGAEEAAPEAFSVRVGSFRLAAGLALSADSFRALGGSPSNLVVDRAVGHVVDRYLPGESAGAHALREFAADTIEGKVKNALNAHCGN